MAVKTPDPYIAVKFEAGEAIQEILSARLYALPFYAFEESPDGLTGYLRRSDWTKKTQKALREICGEMEIPYDVKSLKDENWNVKWESDFNPVVVARFCCVRASFHDRPEGVRYDIVIDPKMTFGTGHHATTYLMMRHMQNMEIQGNTVLDFGCGTGVLAILAGKMGAKRVTAIDIDPAAVENCLENVHLNGVRDIRILSGDIRKVARKRYDVILANINRSVILDSLPAFRKMLRRNGRVLISGFLQDDAGAIRAALREVRLQEYSIHQKEEWLCLEVGRM